MPLLVGVHTRLFAVLEKLSNASELFVFDAALQQQISQHQAARLLSSMV